MSYFSDIFPKLHYAEYARLYLNLKFMESCLLPQGGFLQLRRELFSALDCLKERGLKEAHDRLKSMLLPPLPSDQMLRRQVKSPPSAMVIAPDVERSGTIEEGELIPLPILLVGSAVRMADDVLRLFKTLGETGLYCQTGRFSICGVEAETANGERVSLVIDNGMGLGETLPVSDFKWWLENQPVYTDLEIQFLSPFRLVRGGKPLFKPGFSDLLDSVARRIGAMVSCHCGVDMALDRDALSQLAAGVEVLEYQLFWQDWRLLRGDYQRQKLGGVLGSLRVSGPSLDDVLWILQLGQLLNSGKGAAYGAGQYLLSGV